MTDAEKARQMIGLASRKGTRSENILLRRAQAYALASIATSLEWIAKTYCGMPTEHTSSPVPDDFDPPGLRGEFEDPPGY